MIDIACGGAQTFSNGGVLLVSMTNEGGPALPTLRCPECGNADLLFKPSGEIRCGRCMKRWERSQLVRSSGTAGSSYDHDIKDGEEG